MVALALAIMLPINAASRPGATETELSVQMQGKTPAFSRQKGNCLSCHEIEDEELPGNIGPALVDLQERYRDKAALQAQIRDASIARPTTIMPPYGRHRILSDDEIGKIVDYLWSLHGHNR